MSKRNKSDITENLEELRATLDHAVTLYNSISPKAKVTLKEDTRATNNMFVCTYDDDKVGLFRREEVCYYPFFWDNDVYDTNLVYFGIDSDYIGSKRIHEFRNACNRWNDVGYLVTDNEKSYITNCKMTNAVPFDLVRLIMYREGKLQSYQVGTATDRELIDVLSYASDHFVKEKDKQKEKK